jgi:DNA-binding response OmpR family regulator
MNNVETVPGPCTTTESRRVLVVDDDEDAREIVACAIVALGHACALARDGVEAWEIHNRERADIVISDWKMPRMNGVELCRRIRSADPVRAYTRFIFVTGNGGAAHRLAGTQAGADDFLVKPILLDQLEACLRFGIRELVGAKRERPCYEGLGASAALIAASPWRLSQRSILR